MGQLSKYRENQKRLIDDASTGSQMPPSVSIGDNEFTLTDPGGDDTQVPHLPDGPALDVVFVDRNEKTSKLYWGRPYVKGAAAERPKCFSDNGIAPSSAATEPQHATCMDCPHNVVGSAIGFKGTKIRACEDLKKLAVIVRGFPGAYLFTVKKGSFKTWNNYTAFLRMQRMPDGSHVDLSDVITRVRFVGQGLLSFDAIELVEDGSELAQQVIEIWERNKQADATGVMVGRFDQPYQGALPAPQGAGVVAGPTGQLRGTAEPPPPQGSSLIFKPPQQPKPEAPKTTRTKDDRAAIQPVPPQQVVQPPKTTPPPADVANRLENLFKLPRAK